MFGWAEFQLLKVGAECWVGTPEEAAADKFKGAVGGPDNACIRNEGKPNESKGMGKDWHNDVYRIRVKAAPA